MCGVVVRCTQTRVFLFLVGMAGLVGDLGWLGLRKRGLGWSCFSYFGHCMSFALLQGEEGGPTYRNGSTRVHRSEYEGMEKQRKLVQRLPFNIAHTSQQTCKEGLV